MRFLPLARALPHVLFCAVAGALLASSPAAARTLLVKPDGTGAYPNIRAAVIAAVPGDTVLLTDGVFRGTGNRDIEFYGKTITLLSQSGDPARCAIDNERAWGHRVLFLHQEEGAATLIEGISVRGGWMDETQFPFGHGAGAMVWGSQATFRRCVFENNYAATGAGAHVFEGQARFEDCVFRDNEAYLAGGGVEIESCDKGFLTRCHFWGNRAGGGGGMGLSQSDAGVADCTFAGNAALYLGGGLAAYRGTAYLRRSILWNNCADQGYDLWLNLGGAADVTCSCMSWDGIYGRQYATFQDEGIWDDPLFCGPVDCQAAPTTDGDYRLDANSPCLPGQSICGELVGGLGQGCGVSALDSRSGRTVERLALAVENPVRGRISATIETDAPGSVFLSLADVSGRILRRFEATGSAGVGPRSFSAPLGDVSAGSYLLVAKQDVARSVRPIVIVR